MNRKTVSQFLVSLPIALVLSLFFFPGCASSRPMEGSNAPVGIERWSENHPKASVELGEWVKRHPKAAAKFFEWDGTHPERSREFVTWTITHPRKSIDSFAVQHPGWPVFDQIMENHRPAAETFMAWCRRHPRAAEALMSHSGGLRWAGEHLYKTSWILETP